MKEKRKCQMKWRVKNGVLKKWNEINDNFKKIERKREIMKMKKANEICNLGKRIIKINEILKNMT